MFGPRLSFSKLRVLSHLLECSVLSLRSNNSVRQFSLMSNHISTSSKIKNIFWNHRPARVFSSGIGCDSPFESINFEAITKGDEDLLKKLKVIILEAEVMRQEGMRVPNTITDIKWSELLNTPSRAQRVKLLQFWWITEKKKEKGKKKKADALKKKEELKEPEKSDHIHYGLAGSTILMRVYDTTIDQANNYKLIQAMMFGQNLVLDCSYDEYMNKMEASLCASQLKILFAENRLAKEPFNMYFCNVNREGNVFQKLNKCIPTLYDDAFPLNITENSYLELFPKEKLVYLTPHCREEMKTFDHDDIYIIGAMVDKVNTDPLSLGKAKAQGLRMAKLPLDRYLDWGVGGKSLTLNQMLLILLELKTSGDWQKALENVPKRKLKNKLIGPKSRSRPRNKLLNINHIILSH